MGAVVAQPFPWHKDRRPLVTSSFKMDAHKVVLAALVKPAGAAEQEAVERCIYIQEPA
jgi:hypothetical protein